MSWIDLRREHPSAASEYVISTAQETRGWFWHRTGIAAAWHVHIEQR